MLLLALILASTPASAPSVPPAALPAGVDLSYTLELVREPFPFVSVTFVTPGAASGTTRLGLSDWGGVEHAENEVHGLTVSDDHGQALPVEYSSAQQETDHGPSWVVHHPPNALLRVHYALVSTQQEVGEDSASYYRPLVTPSFFHAIGNVALMQVRDQASETPLHIAFHWRGFQEAGWKVACSFSMAQDDFVATESPDNFRDAIFLAGELRLVRRDIGPGESAPLWLAFAGNDWGFTDDAFADMAAKIVTAQRAFFHDPDWPYFLISVIPVGRYREHGYSQGGTGLTHSFGVFLSPKTSLAMNAEGSGVPWLLSHELFHLWNGRRYELEDPEALGYWFSEGFTNFYARRLLYRAGLVGTDAYLTNLNQEISRYLLSPVREQPAVRIALEFWHDQTYEDLPYKRGDVVAVLVDAEIRRVSHGEKSLDDLMKELLAKPVTPAPKVTSDTFLATIASYTSPAFAGRIRKIVVDGATAHIDPGLLEPCLHGHVEFMGPFEAGFDEAVAHTRHVIAGVREGSAAYRAGLRNGQSLAGFSLHHGDPRREVEATILEEGGKTRTVHYLPQGKKISVTQFTADPALPADCSSKL